MNPSNGDPLRCPRHPSESFTGFCSACLVERLSAARLPARPAATDTVTHWEAVRPRRTLLYLFQLDDMANANGDGDGGVKLVEDGGASSSGAGCDKDPGAEEGCADRCSRECHGDGQLQRKRSLRQSCEWIVCCETGKDSWVPSRQSWDGSAAPGPGGRKGLHGWNRRAANPIWGFMRKPGHVLKRSLSESWRYGREDRRRSMGNGAVGSRSNGSRLGSSGGKDSEISVLASAHGDVHSGRRESLMKRLYWLGRSRSVPYSSPRSVHTGSLRFHLTPLRTNSQGRWVHLFAGGFFGVQRHEQ